VGDFIALGCGADTLRAVAAGLTHFGPADGAPDWLLAGIWLRAGDEPYLATVSTDVLADGFVARPLNIDTPAEFKARIEAELPDIAARMHILGHGTDAPAVVHAPVPPASLHEWAAGPYATTVLVRVAKRESCIHRVACGLLFTSDTGGSLLIGADPSTMAMVLSDDPALIDRYCAACETLTPADYLIRSAG